MTTNERLKSIFKNTFVVDNLKNTKHRDFQAYIANNIDKIKYENFIDPSQQRDLSLKFHWGHNHDFGRNFKLEGKMKERHIDIIASFMDNYGLPHDLEGKKILDIGVWTGGTSLLLTALGAEVYAIEEVDQYAATVNYLAWAFGIENQLRCFSMSLYEFLPMFANEFDYIIYSGVIYHVTDPLISLRMIFTALKDGGSVFIETLGNDFSNSVCIYEGSGTYSSGNKDDLNRGGWNYFIPSSSCLERWCMDSGFQKVKIGDYDQKRIKGVATRTQYKDFCRAGVSMKSIR